MSPVKYALMESETERNQVVFGTTPLPDAAPDNTLGDCWRSENTMKGSFAISPWSFHFPVRSDTAGGTQDGRVRVRLWKGTDPTGSGATEITTETLLGAIVYDVYTFVDYDSYLTWTPPVSSS
jgi:hypothetical protein